MIATDPKPRFPDVLEQVEPDLAACWLTMLDEIRQGGLKLPLMPRAAQRVIGLANDPNSDVADLVDVIQKDQALAGHILRIANSAAFGAAESISSLQQAATRLGMKFIADSAFAISLKSDMFRIPGLEDVAASIWKHALAAGVYGREIARAKRHNIESQYLCSLLHTIGKPVALNLLATLRARNQWRVANSDLILLTETAHAQLGSTLAAQWDLPRQIIHVCQWYQFPGRSPEFEQETAMTYLSSRLGQWVVQPEAWAEDELRQGPVFQLLNLYPDEVDELLERREEVIATVDAMNI